MNDRGISEALGSGPQFRNVGSFRFLFENEKWEWSDEAAALHGYAPGEVEPTTELLASHKHPDDRTRFEQAVSEMLTEHIPFSSRHRIIDKNGQVHTVAVVAKTIVDDDNNVIGTDGFYLDLESDIEEAVSDRLEEHVENFRRNRATIEQVKGMIMLTYGVSADRAFEVLVWRSQEVNVKVADLCTAIRARISSEIVVGASTQREFDNILLTAHAMPVN